MPLFSTWVWALASYIMVSSELESRPSRCLGCGPGLLKTWTSWLTCDGRMTPLPKHHGRCFYNLTISRHSSLVPNEMEALSGCWYPFKPWPPGRSNFYCVKNKLVTWFPFIFYKSRLKLGSSISSFSGNNSFRSGCKAKQ